MRVTPNMSPISCKVIDPFSAAIIVQLWFDLQLIQYLQSVFGQSISASLYSLKHVVSSIILSDKTYRSVGINYYALGKFRPLAVKPDEAKGILNVPLPILRLA